MGLRGCSLPSRQSTVGSVSEASLVCLNINNLGVTSGISLVSSLVTEDLVALDKSSFGVLAAVDEIRIVESKLNRTVHNVICSLNAKHEAVVLVACWHSELTLTDEPIGAFLTYQLHISSFQIFHGSRCP
jgi:hypothetical protein